MAPAVAVADVLIEELGRLVDVVAPGRVDPDGLERAERDHDRVVLVARGTDDDEWREFCLRQADRLVLVAEDSRPDERVSAPRGAHLVVPGDALSASDVSGWVEALAPVQIHSLGARPVTWAASLRPLARRLGGRSIGLALAGGGARAFAHIGVIEELLASGVEIDRVSGCSVGAYVAALFACGLDPDGIDARCYEDFVLSNPFADYTLPRVALTRGVRGRTMLARTFGDLRIEQLPREFVCVSTNLLSRDLEVHRGGLLREALGASMSLPGLFPPYRIDGQLLIDGGVLDNLPVDPLCDREEGPVIAVNIGASTGGHASGGEGPRTPMLGDTLMRVLIMSSSTALDRARERAAVVVTPDTRGVGLLEFHQIDRVRAAGREAARAALDNLGPALTGAT
jgi:predicted acylesterase/phospholipase RssA